MAHTGRESVVLIADFPLKKPQRAKLNQALEHRLGKEIEVRDHGDPSLIGGVDH